MVCRINLVIVYTFNIVQPCTVTKSTYCIHVYSVTVQCVGFWPDLWKRVDERSLVDAVVFVAVVYPGKAAVVSNVAVRFFCDRGGWWVVVRRGGPRMSNW